MQDESNIFVDKATTKTLISDDLLASAICYGIPPCTGDAHQYMLGQLIILALELLVLVVLGLFYWLA